MQRRTGALIIITTLMLTSCSGNTTGQGEQQPTAQVEQADTSTTVVYQVRGETPTANLTLATSSGTTQHADAPVADAPLGFWRDSTELDPGDLAYVSAQASSTATDVTCIILVAGQEVARNTATGPHSIATCEATTP